MRYLFIFLFTFTELSHLKYEKNERILQNMLAFVGSLNNMGA